MHLGFSEEQDELRRGVRRFLGDRSPLAEVRRLMETSEGTDPDVWRQLGRELGLCGVHIPEEYGGQGLSVVELCIVCEELGRALLCAPYFGSIVLAAGAILNAATEPRKKELLPGIAAGETVATLAIAEPAGCWDASSVSLTATPAGGAFRLDGVKSFVLDGHTADLIVVVARDPETRDEDGLSFLIVRGDARGLERRPLRTLDATRKLARLEFSGVQAELLGEQGTGARALARTLEQASVALANEMVGGAQLVLEMAVDYAKTRVQFGRPIGSFQAIKHKCADMLVDVELAKSAAYHAASAAADMHDDLPALASLAKAFCADAYRKVAAENIQIHGGIGFTWEHDAHLYFKRAKSSEVFLGDSAMHFERYAQRLGL